MNKIILTEKQLERVVNRISKQNSLKVQLKEQGSAFDWKSSLDGWHIQKDAREKGKYCRKGTNGADNFEGQHCVAETNWYDWENFGTSVNTIGVSAHGKWKCGVGCVVTGKREVK